MPPGDDPAYLQFVSPEFRILCDDPAYPALVAALQLAPKSGQNSESERVTWLVQEFAAVCGTCAKSLQASASKNSQSKIRYRLLAREASGENPELRVMRSSAQISSLKAKIQSSEFAVGLGGREKQPEFRIQSCDPSLRELEMRGRELRIQSSRLAAGLAKGEIDRGEFRVQSFATTQRDMCSQFKVQNTKALAQEQNQLSEVIAESYMILGFFITPYSTATAKLCATC